MAAFSVVSIIGGQGRMGQFFARYFREQRCEVLCFDREHQFSDALVLQGLKRSDLVLVSVPIPIACGLLQRLCPLLSSETLLCDVTSLKLRVCEVLQRCAPGESIGLHPMFAPSVASYAGHKIICCPQREGSKAAALRALFCASGFVLQDASPEQHDRAVSVVQVLLHFSKFVSAHALRESGLSLAETLRFSSPVYTLELALIARLFSQDPGLYEAIQRENPFAQEMRELLVRSAHHVADLLAGAPQAGDSTTTISRELDASAAWFGSFSDEAAQLSEQLVSVVASVGKGKAPVVE